MTDASIAQKGIDQKYCRDCGSVIALRAEICPKCGIRQSNAPRTLGEKSKIAAGLFALFLGGIGIHKFYLGKPGQGILYILLCWTFIPAIVAFVEGIIYLCSSDEQFAEKYG